MERSYLIFFLRLNIEIILSCGNFLPKITFHFSYLSIFDLKLVFTIFLLANYNSQIYIFASGKLTVSIIISEDLNSCSCSSVRSVQLLNRIRTH